MNSILVIDKISKKYQTLQGEVEAISDISLNLEEEDFIAIVGPSGCGKSTLLSILCGLESKSSGNFIFPNAYKNKIGYMLQSDSLFPWLTILENCLLGLKIENRLTDENIEYVKDLLITYGLKDFMESYPNNLSGGMRQRVVCIQ